MSNSLFAHLAVRFGPHPENLATEALGFILRESESARAALQSLVLQLGVELPLDLAYQNQVSGDDDARPDLIGVTPDGTEPVVVEAKFWAGLTEQQPVAYLARLPETGGALLVVGPRARIDLVWHELLRRCETAGNSTTAVPCPLGEARVAAIGRTRMVLVSWGLLLDVIERRLEAENDTSTREDLRQLRGLCDRMDSEAFLPLLPEELSSTSWRRIVEFGSIVDDATATLSAMKLISLKGCRSAAGNGYYGRYAWLRGVGVFLIADVRKWVKYSSTPIWLSVYGSRWRESNAVATRKALASLEVASPPRVFIATDGFPTVPLFLPTGVERVRVVEAVVAQVETISRMIEDLAESLSAAPAGPPPDDSTL
jgi:hypothetical protein